MRGYLCSAVDDKSMDEWHEHEHAFTMCLGSGRSEISRLDQGGGLPLAQNAEGGKYRHRDRYRFKRLSELKRGRPAAPQSIYPWAMRCPSPARAGSRARRAVPTADEPTRTTVVPHRMRVRGHSLQQSCSSPMASQTAYVMSSQLSLPTTAAPIHCDPCCSEGRGHDRYMVVAPPARLAWDRLPHG